MVASYPSGVRSAARVLSAGTKPSFTKSSATTAAICAVVPVPPHVPAATETEPLTSVGPARVTCAPSVTASPVKVSVPVAAAPSGVSRRAAWATPSIVSV